MRKSKIFGFLALAMFALNVVLIFFLIKGRPMHHMPQQPKMIIIEKLDFTPSQIEDYEVLIDKHLVKHKQLNKQIHENKAELYQLLKAEYNEDDVNALTNEIANKLMAIEQLNYNHFAEIKALCKDDQIEKFNQFTTELADLFKNMTKNDHPEH